MDSREAPSLTEEKTRRTTSNRSNRNASLIVQDNTRRPQEIQTRSVRRKVQRSDMRERRKKRPAGEEGRIEEDREIHKENKDLQRSQVVISDVSRLR